MQLVASAIINIEKTERLFPLLANELHGPIVEHVGRVPGRFGSLAVLVKNRVERRALAGHARPVVDPWARRVVVAHVPLADVAGFVAAVAKDSGERDQLVALHATVGVVNDSVMVSILTGEQTCANGRAERRRAESVAESGSLVGNSVDAGRSHEGMACTGNLIPAQIIDEDDQDIRPVGGHRGGGHLGQE